MRTLDPVLEKRIDECKLWMFDGDQDRVAAATRKSREWVNKVLNKKAFNPEILEAAIRIMDENKARFGCSTPQMKVA